MRHFRFAFILWGLLFGLVVIAVVTAAVKRRSHFTGVDASEIAERRGWHSS